MQLLIFTLLLLGYTNASQSASGCTLTTVKQDIIFMIDYSGSICSSVTCCDPQTGQTYSWGCEYYSWERCCVNEWEQLLTFAKSVIDDQLPDDSRVAALGFGRSSGIEQGWYDLGDASSAWKSVADASANMMSVYKVGGSTYLAAGIEWLLESSPIDWSADTDRKRLLMVLTDGDANDGDKLCAQAPELRQKGIETVVVGITDDFISETVTCLVDDPSTDIIQVLNWNNLADYVDLAGTLTCEANQVWELTEVKAGGADKFLEFVNTAGSFDGQTGGSIIRVNSNLLANSFDITDAIPQSSTVVIGSTDSLSGCTGSNGCYYYKATFSSAYVDDESKTDGWEVEVQQVFTVSGQEDPRDLNGTVIWDASFPTISNSQQYSLELTSLGFDNSAGASWRKSCSSEGSFGSINDEVCPACSDNFECNPDSIQEADWPNSCGSNGCVCIENGYYDGTGTGSCLPIPPAQNCRFLRDADHPENDIVQWEAAQGGKVYGYQVSETLQSGTQYSSSLEFKFPNQVSDDATAFVKSIGEYNVDGEGRYQATRWGPEVACVTEAFTSEPTVSPTYVPTQTPTLYQPLVFLSGFDLENDVIQPINFTFDQADLQQVDVRIYLSPPHEVVVNWALYDVAGNSVETGSVTFPANALEKLADTLQATLTIDHPVGAYTFRLLATDVQLPNDPSGRLMYEVYEPNEIAININPRPVDVPTMQPTEYQPLALLSGFTANNVTGDPETLRYHSAEDIKVTVRISPAPAGFAVDVHYKVTEISSGNIIEVGSVNFPANSFATGSDIQDVTLTNVTLNTTESENEWMFQLLDTTETIPTDPDDATPRRAYTLYYPTSINVLVERYVPQEKLNTETVTEEKLDWWLIMIIVLVALGIIAVVGYFGYSYYVSYKMEKEKREDAEENLAYEEDGIGGFFERGGVDNTQENPLHAKQVDTGKKIDDDMNAQMVFVDDDAPFSMSVHNKEYEQRQIELDSDGNRLQQNANTADNGGMRVDPSASLAISNGGSEWGGEQSPSTYEIQDGTLPPAFN